MWSVLLNDIYDNSNAVPEQLQQVEDHSFVTLDCHRMHQLQGIHLVRVPTIEPVLNPNWFVTQIAKARSRLVRRVLDDGRTKSSK